MSVILVSPIDLQPIDFVYFTEVWASHIDVKHGHTVPPRFETFAFFTLTLKIQEQPLHSSATDSNSPSSSGSPNRPPSLTDSPVVTHSL